jgi:hypothetical protein
MPEAGPDAALPLITPKGVRFWRLKNLRPQTNPRPAKPLTGSRSELVRCGVRLLPAPPAKTQSYHPHQAAAQQQQGGRKRGEMIENIAPRHHGAGKSIGD